jgi:hypothetical protein
MANLGVRDGGLFAKQTADAGGFEPSGEISDARVALSRRHAPVVAMHFRQHGNRVREVSTIAGDAHFHSLKETGRRENVGKLPPAGHQQAAHDRLAIRRKAGGRRVRSLSG